MGLLDFLSSTPIPPLEEKYKRLLSQHYTPDKINERLYEKALKELAKAQSALSSELAPEEEIRLITYSDYYPYNGLGIVTNHRVMQFRNKIEKQLALLDIADIKVQIFRDGSFLVNLIGNGALPYAETMERDPRFLETAAMMKYYSNTIMLSMPTHELHSEFISVIEVAKNKP